MNPFPPIVTSPSPIPIPIPKAPQPGYRVEPSNDPPYTEGRDRCAEPGLGAADVAVAPLDFVGEVLVAVVTVVAVVAVVLGVPPPGPVADAAPDAIDGLALVVSAPLFGLQLDSGLNGGTRPPTKTFVLALALAAVGVVFAGTIGLPVPVVEASASIGVGVEAVLAAVAVGVLMFGVVVVLDIPLCGDLPRPPEGPRHELASPIPTFPDEGIAREAEGGAHGCVERAYAAFA